MKPASDHNILSYIDTYILEIHSFFLIDISLTFFEIGTYELQ